MDTTYTTPATPVLTAEMMAAIDELLAGIPDDETADEAEMRREVEAQYAQFEAEQKQQPRAVLRDLLEHLANNPCDDDDMFEFLESRYPANDESDPVQELAGRCAAFDADVARTPEVILAELVDCMGEHTLCDFLNQRYPMAD